MERFGNFILRLMGRSVTAFFVTIAVVTALWFPIIMLAAIGAAAELETTSTLETEFVYGNPESENKILMIPVTGIIYGDQGLDPSGDFFGVTGDSYGYEIKEYLRKAANDDTIKGVVLDINSPGGTIYGSQAIYDGIQSYKNRTGNPVHSHITGLGASGAYWAAVGTDRITADIGSIIGSIGVINGGFYYYNGVTQIDGGLLSGGVTTREGVENYTITSGKGKDLGNPFRRPTEEELRSLQTGADNNYNMFVRLVSNRRNIPEETIRTDIGAYIYDNLSAQSKKLIDGTRNREQAFDDIAQELKYEQNYQVVTAQVRLSRLEALLSSSASFFKKAEPLQAKLKAGFCTPYKPLVYYGSVAEVCNK